VFWKSDFETWQGPVEVEGKESQVAKVEERFQPFSSPSPDQCLGGLRCPASLEKSWWTSQSSLMRLSADSKEEDTGCSTEGFPLWCTQTLSSENCWDGTEGWEERWWPYEKSSSVNCEEGR